MYYERLSASFVRRYINRYYCVPVEEVPKDVLEEYSFQRCAAYEILERITNNPDKDGRVIVEDYIREMHKYTQNALNKDKYWDLGRRFDLGQEVAEDILVWFIINGRRKDDE